VTLSGTDYAAVFAASPTPCVLLTPDLVIRDANAAYCRVTGFDRDELIGRELFDVFSAMPGRSEPDTAARLRASLERARDTGTTSTSGVHRYDAPHPRSGRPVQRYWTETSVPVRDETGRTGLLLHRIDDVSDIVTAEDVRGLLATSATAPAGPDGEAPGLRELLPDLLARVRDLQVVNRELQVARDELAARALHDPLTGLLVRSVFFDELGRALARLARRPHHVAVLFVDLDRLKLVNDTYGHATGDELIRVVAQRLRDCVRPSDPVARVGGDEFVVLLDDLTDPREAEVVAERLMARLVEPCTLAAGPTLTPSGSMGVAATADPDLSPDLLVSQADAAMYAAKQAGRGLFRMFDETTLLASSARQREEEELREAVAGGQLRLHYQPIVDLQSGAVHGVEALLRWQHPTRGLLTAGDFIEVAEDSGLVGRLDAWVIREGCRQLAAWDAELGDDAPQRLFVNLSHAELVQRHLGAHVADSAAAVGVDPGRLVLEITERGVTAEPGAVHGVVGVLRELGCELAIDDFGTGYSSLSRLVELPAGIIKIDGSFVRDVSRDKASAAVVSAVLLLAHNLHKTVVAEGVEDVDALETLRELGCEYAQGYHLARPQPARRLPTRV